MDNQQLQELIDREAIKEVRYNWAAGLDQQDWTLVESLLMEEVETDFTLWGMSPQKVSRAELANSFRRSLSRPGLKTQHIFANFRIKIEGDKATSNFYQLAQHYIQGFEGGEEFILRAEYSDTLIRTAEGWRVSGVRLAAVYTTGNPAILAA